MPEDDLELRARARVGRVLDEKYLLERLLGVGGMAAVYAARHRNGARAAVKILHAEIARDQEVLARFLHEGRAANRVEHPGAVRVIDDDVVRSGDDQGSAYLVMELLEGESVHARARRNGGVLPEAEVLAIADDVLEVLEAAHARGIVHRDLKPDNLFFVREGDRERVKVLDFGIARIADQSRMTVVGTTLGTPSYMAPEQARGQRDRIDGRTDLFALGATLFRLLVGRRIHDGETSTEVLAKMATLPAPPIRSVSAAVPPDVAAIIDRALRFEREARYPDAAAMHADVRAVRAGAPLPSGGVPADAAPPAIGFAAGAEATGFARAPEVATVASRANTPEAPTLAAPVPAPGASPAAHTEQLPISGTASTEPVRAEAAPAPIELPATISRPAAIPVTSAVPISARPASTKPSPKALALIAGAALALVTAGAVVLYLALRSPADEPTPAAAEEDLDVEIPTAGKTADPRPAQTAEQPDDPTPQPTPTANKPAAKSGGATTATGGKLVKPAPIPPPPTTTSTGAAAPTAAPPPAAAPPPPTEAQPADAPPAKGKGKGKKK